MIEVDRILAALRQDAGQIWRAALAAVTPGRLLPAAVQVTPAGLRLPDGHIWPLPPQGEVPVLAVGKAAVAMTAALAERLPGHRLGGWGVAPLTAATAVAGVRILPGGHPLPDERSVVATREILRWLETDLDPATGLVVLLSGGGSALLCLPAPGITLADKMATVRRLLTAGADIGELNCVRKHLSAVKGGRLAERLGTRPVLTLILSDVAGDPPDVIASGPTVADPTTYEDALNVLRRHRLLEKVPAGVRACLEKGSAGVHPESPKPAPAGAARVADRTAFGSGPTVHRLGQQQLLVIGNNRVACLAARDAAERQGYDSLLLSSELVGDTRECARFHQGIVREQLVSRSPGQAPLVIISGGETTVNVRGDGRGGRNQEFVLSWVRSLADWSTPVVVAAVGTDGRDGPTDAAGAMADNRSLARARQQGMDPDAYLDCNDSYTFFDGLQDLVRTGPTGTNVGDLRLVLIGSGPAPTSR
ncbi:MAG: DUF4147 domain-containing protein [Acidobacteria bacterium]|nr:DUF4147 domain-containing protein [Acidobacteriota bacterium]